MVEVPKTLEDWKIETINGLIKYLDIESETLDIKGSDLGELSKHICAMANTSGGFLVLGIEEIKTGETITHFDKRGFTLGTEDAIKQKIGNARFEIEPVPEVEDSILLEGNKFFVILYIKNNSLNKPYFVKNSGRCFIRISNSSKPASRSTILNLFSSVIKNVESVKQLIEMIDFLKEDLINFGEEIRINGLGNNNPIVNSKLTPLDLSLIKSAILSTGWFLRKAKLLGGHEKDGYSQEIGFYYYLHELRKINAQIASCNSTVTFEQKRVFCNFFSSWSTSQSELRYAIDFLDKVLKSANEFIQNSQL